MREAIMPAAKNVTELRDDDHVDNLRTDAA